MTNWIPIIVIAVISVVASIGAIYLIVIYNRSITGKELQNLDESVRKGLGKLEQSIINLKQTNQNFDLNGKKRHP